MPFNRQIALAIEVSLAIVSIALMSGVICRRSEFEQNSLRTTRIVLRSRALLIAAVAVWASSVVYVVALTFVFLKQHHVSWVMSEPFRSTITMALLRFLPVGGYMGLLGGVFGGVVARGGGHRAALMFSGLCCAFLWLSMAIASIP